MNVQTPTDKPGSSSRTTRWAGSLFAILPSSHFSKEENSGFLQRPGGFRLSVPAVFPVGIAGHEKQLLEGYKRISIPKDAPARTSLHLLCEQKRPPSKYSPFILISSSISLR